MDLTRTALRRLEQQMLTRTRLKVLVIRDSFSLIEVITIRLATMLINAKNISKMTMIPPEKYYFHLLEKY